MPRSADAQPGATLSRAREQARETIGAAATRLAHELRPPAQCLASLPLSRPQTRPRVGQADTEFSLDHKEGVG